MIVFSSLTRIRITRDYFLFWLPFILFWLLNKLFSLLTAWAVNCHRTQNSCSTNWNEIVPRRTKRANSNQFGRIFDVLPLVVIWWWFSSAENKNSHFGQTTKNHRNGPESAVLCVVGFSCFETFENMSRKHNLWHDTVRTTNWWRGMRKVLCICQYDVLGTYILFLIIARVKLVPVSNWWFTKQYGARIATFNKIFNT